MNRCWLRSILISMTNMKCRQQEFLEYKEYYGALDSYDHLYAMRGSKNRLEQCWCDNNEYLTDTHQLK